MGTGKNGKRKRSKTDRFGSESVNANKDAYFDDDSSDVQSILDVDDSFTDRSVKSSETASLKIDTQIGNNNIASKNHLSRVEAKLDCLIDEMHKLTRMIIPLTINSTNADVSNGDSDFLSMFPLKTEESMNQLEDKLNNSAFRRLMVSIDVEFIWQTNF